MVTKIYLIRHAEAEGNVVPFFQGSIDTALTEKGEQQLEYLAERFRHVPLDAIYFSPYQRARLTAEAVNRYHNLNMIPEYDLRELNGGSWEGRRVFDLRDEYPEKGVVWRVHFRGDSVLTDAHVLWSTCIDNASFFKNGQHIWCFSESIFGSFQNY